MNLDNDGTAYESNLPRRRSKNSEFVDLDAKFDKSGFEEIENNVRSFMCLQFEHNNFFGNELKEQKSFMGYMNKELDDMSKEFYGLKSQFSHLN